MDQVPYTPEEMVSRLVYRKTGQDDSLIVEDPITKARAVVSLRGSWGPDVIFSRVQNAIATVIKNG